MEDELLKYISKFSSLTTEEAQQIAENIKVKTFKKGTVLIKAGEFYDFCFFVLKGCVRQYYLKNGAEKTTSFFTEEQAVVNFYSDSQERAPVNYYLSCVEDCVLIIGESGSEIEMYQKFPKLEAITRMMVEQDFGKTQQAFATFIVSSPEERYLNLLDTRPDLLQRTPQHQLASYLGITPESLSRIRKRVSVKK